MWSPDGNRIAFTSGADNLVVGDTNPWSDVFVKDLGSGAVSLISTDGAGQPTFLRQRMPRWSPDRLLGGERHLDQATSLTSSRPSVSRARWSRLSTASSCVRDDVGPL